MENIEVEVKLLSTLLYDRILGERFVGYIFPQLFTGLRGELCKVIKTAFMNKEPFDRFYLRSKLLENKNLSPLDIEVTLKKLSIDHMLTSMSVMWSIDELRRLYFLRTSDMIAKKMQSSSNEGNIKKILSIGNSIGALHRKAFNYGERKDHLLDSIGVINNPDEYIQAPIPKMYKAMGGFTRSDLSAIGGKSSHNKTTFSLFLMVQAIKLGIVNHGIIYTVDEPGEKIARRIIACEADISLTAMRNKDIVLDYKEIREILKPVLNKITIVDDVYRPEDIYQSIMDNKPDWAIVDYIQGLDFPDNDGISLTGITYTLKLLKRASRNLNNNILVTSQVRDKVIDERFEDKIPRPHDFYYASTIRQAVREQCVVYWKYKDTQEEEDMKYFTFIIWKSTYSDTNRITLGYEPDKARFYEIQTKPKPSVWEEMNK